MLVTQPALVCKKTTRSYPDRFRGWSRRKPAAAAAPGRKPAAGRTLAAVAAPGPKAFLQTTDQDQAEHLAAASFPLPTNTAPNAEALRAVAPAVAGMSQPK